MKPLTREQIREIDRRAIEEYGIPGVVLMENAGANAAQLIREQFEIWRKIKEPRAEARASAQQPTPHRASEFAAELQCCIFCGRGNNGGDGFVIARHLSSAGFPVDIILLADPEQLAHDAKTNHDIATKMKIPIRRFDGQAAGDLVANSQIVVDALLGTGFSGKVRPPIDRAIELINSAAGALKVAIDVPSGLDCDTGRPASATVKADLTVTFVAPKIGFASAGEYTGKVLVADIGAPRAPL